MHDSQGMCCMCSIHCINCIHTLSKSPRRHIKILRLLHFRFDCWCSVLHLLPFLPAGLRDARQRGLCKGDKLHHTPSPLALNMGVLTLDLCRIVPYRASWDSYKTLKSEFFHKRSFLLDTNHVGHHSLFLLLNLQIKL